MNCDVPKAKTSPEPIKELLIRLGQAREETLEIFSPSTRDKPQIQVLRDRQSGVIFINNHFVGDEEYRLGDYRSAFQSAGLETSLDTTRRIESHLQFISNRIIADFGCGAGEFLRAAQPHAKSIQGIELQESYIESLNRDGIPCTNDVELLQQSVQTLFMFHSLEHLSDPVTTLRKIRNRISKDDGILIAEVPHARDFLLDALKCEKFKKFTLWSQHLILHTRESLRAILTEAGFEVTIIKGIQRYGISNHLHWLSHGAPGGHKSHLSALETEGLRKEYADALARIDCNDTLVAFAKVNVQS